MDYLQQGILSHDTFVKVDIRTSIAYTRINAGYKFHGARSGREPEPGLDYVFAGFVMPALEKLYDILSKVEAVILFLILIHAGYLDHGPGWKTRLEHKEASESRRTQNKRIIILPQKFLGFHNEIFRPRDPPIRKYWIRTPVRNINPH